MVREREQFVGGKGVVEVEGGAKDRSGGGEAAEVLFSCTRAGAR